LIGALVFFRGNRCFLWRHAEWTTTHFEPTFE
jgi:hypothetical protein